MTSHQPAVCPADTACTFIKYSNLQLDTVAMIKTVAMTRKKIPPKKRNSSYASADQPSQSSFIIPFHYSKMPH